MKKVVLIDGHNLLFRMFYGIPSSIKNSQGKEIRGLIGFIGSLRQIVTKFNPESLFVVFDSETSKSENLKIDDSYKSNRLEFTDVLDDDNPFCELPMIKKALKYLSIPYTEVEKYEADDFIASIVSNKEECYEYIIVSTDSDFIQLVNNNIYLYVPRGKNSVLYNEREVFYKYNITPKKYALYKALVGDRSDNIKGVKGIGKCLAAKILEYPSLEEYISNNLNSRYANMLLESKDVIEKNIKLITLNRNIDTSNIIYEKLSNKIIEYKTYEIIEKIGER